MRWSDFDGKYRIVYFGYAYCPDVCPLDVQRMMQGYERFKEAEPELAAQVQPIFITIDPARDTPAVVGEFTSAFSRRPHRPDRHARRRSRRPPRRSPSITQKGEGPARAAT